MTAESAPIPRPEHPRPDAYRADWINLNGEWEFAFDPLNMGEQERWHRPTGDDDHFNLKITVPFPWESKLSGIGATAYRGAGWYRRMIEIPADWLERGLHPILHFEAVDWNAKIWVNGWFAGEHDGGYSPFEIDLGPFLFRDAAGRTGLSRRSGGPPLDVQTLASASPVLGAELLPLAQETPASIPETTSGSEKPVPDPGHRIGTPEHARVSSPESQFARKQGNPSSAGGPLRLVLTVRAWDICAADTPLGKQLKEWYTPSSGIWQTVWLEGRQGSHVRQAHFSPDLFSPDPSEGQCHVRIAVVVEEPGTYEISLTSPVQAFAPIRASCSLPLGSSQQSMDIPLPNPRLWSPENPFLYDVRVELLRNGKVQDTLSTYFGMRDISRGKWCDSDHEYVLLNGEPIYLLGALDQAFHPLGLHTYPSDEAIRADVQAALDSGFNLLRCHIKINEPRYYYWADRLGLLLMSDIPSPKIYTARSRANWEATFRDALERDFNHPSIIAWILFNETWGLEEHQTEAGWEWIRKMYQLCRGLDPTRLAEDNSACLYDHVATDLNSWHFYINDYDRARRHVNQVVASTIPGSPFNYVGGEYLQGTEPLLNSEYGGIGARDGDRDISYCLKFLTAELRRHEKIVGYVYTELADIEWEHNGILNYDRSAKEFGYDAFVPGMSVSSIHSPDFIGIDAPPCQTAEPAERILFPLFFSQFGRQDLNQVSILWNALHCNTLGEKYSHAGGEYQVSPRRYSVCPAGEVELVMPGESGLLTLSVEAVLPGGAVIARHYVQVEVHDPALSAAEQRGNQWLLRWNPGDFATTDWSNTTISRGGWKFSASSYGVVEYEVLAPEVLDLASIKGLRLLVEAGACTARRRLDWSAKPGRINYPQTEADRKYGSEVVVSINGVTIGHVRVPDDPCDARGVLSHHNEIDPGSYGFLVDIPVEEGRINAILQRAQSRVFTVRFVVPRTAAETGGLRLYGRRVGGHPVDPTLVFSLEG